MSLFDSLGQPLQKTQQLNPRQQQQAFRNDLAQLKADPVAYAKAHGKSIPTGMSDPTQMAQYLLQSTQVNNPRYQMAMRIINGLQR